MSDEFSDIQLPGATPELLLQTRIQIEKDLGLTGFVYSGLEQPMDLPSLVPQLAQKIAWLRQNSGGDLMKIIYRVDLTERQYRKVGNMPGDWAENMAKAIVLREFQKIVIRRKFS